MDTILHYLPLESWFTLKDEHPLFKEGQDCKFPPGDTLFFASLSGKYAVCFRMGHDEELLISRYVRVQSLNMPIPSRVDELTKENEHE